jgi:hypothetical protein
MEIVLSILGWLAPVLATVLTLVLTALVKKWLDKLGVEKTAKTDELVTSLVGNAVSAAERYAVLKIGEGTPVAGSDKKTQAVKIVLDQLESAGIKDVAAKVVEDRIEAWLHINDPKSVLPASPTS